MKKEKRPLILGIRNGAGERQQLPPRKKIKYEKSLVIRLVITGAIPSKKNCQVADRNNQALMSLLNSCRHRVLTQSDIDQIMAIKPFIRNSKRYQDWEEKIRPDLVAQCARWQSVYSKYGLIYPITKASISIYHYWADPKARDNSNKAESIHDTLVNAGIISDDSGACLFKNAAESAVYKGEILEHQTMIVITAYEW